MHSRNIAEYISGYVDGEGCFSVSFTKRPRFTIGWETKPSFSVSQNHYRAEVLYMMHEYFNAGHLRRDSSDQTLKFEIRRLDDLIEKVIPHFDTYPLLSGKHADFKRFRDVCMLMKHDAHTTYEGFERIVHIAFAMNESGRRRRTKEDVLTFAQLQMKV